VAYSEKMGSMKEDFARSRDGLDIHFLENEGADSNLIPLVIVPGMMGLAGFHEREMKKLLPRRVITITHRGLGKNQPIHPGQGSFAQRATDIAAVTDYLGLKKYFLYGFSRGVSLALAHTLRHPRNVAGLIFHDCEPTYPKISEKWRDNLISANRPHMPAQTVTAYWQDSEAIDLTSRLVETTCPILILRGEKEGSLLPFEKANAMKQLLASVQLSSLPNSAHELADTDQELFVSSISRFMSE
jgi:pimeloyl-ACP methyl ester carboxylesterase